MKLLYLLSIGIIFISAGSVAAEETADTVITGWQKSLAVDVTVTQTSYSDSWTGGENGNVNWISNLNGRAERNVLPWMNFTTTLKLSFGQTLNQETDEATGEKHWRKPEKTTDLIDWENVGKIVKGWVVDPYGAVRLETQFYDGSFGPKKLYFSPLKLTESAGLSRKVYKKEKDFVLTRLGGAARQTLTSVVVDTAALSTERETVSEAGLEWVSDAQLTLNERLKYIGKLTLFKALTTNLTDQEKAASAGGEDAWKAVDINFENIVTAQLSKIIAVIFYAQMLYDKEISKKARWKETLGIGFVFKMF